MSEKKNMTTALIDEILASNAVLFCDQYGDAYIAFNGNGSQVFRANSKTCKQWIMKISHDKFNTIPTTAVVKQVYEMLEAKAYFGGEQNKLDVNIVRNDTGIWYDLGGAAVQVTNKGWAVVNEPPIVFRRQQPPKAQVLPKRGGDLKQLFEYINITKESEQLLFLCYVVAAFIPDIQHPVLILHGTQGAGKTTPMQILKSLVEHSELNGGFSQPKDEADFALSAYTNYLIFYDNLSDIKDWFSDALCKAVTGSSFITRKLWTNDEVFTYTFKRTIVINGLSQVAVKPDLLDRSLVLQLERIADDKRIEHGRFWVEFEKNKPFFLGAIFDTVVKAMEVYPTIKLAKPSRIADFDYWACAIAEVLGFGMAKFVEAREGNTSLQHDYTIEASPVAQAIIEFMRERDEWTGEPAELYSELQPIVVKLQLERSNLWPKDASRLIKAINALTPSLRANSLKVSRPTRSSRRLITFTKLTDANDGTDSKNS